MDNFRRLELEAQFQKARERLVRALKWIVTRGENPERWADHLLENAREALEGAPVNAVLLADRVADKFANEAIGYAKKALVLAEADLSAAHLHLALNIQRQVDEANNAAVSFERHGLYSSALGQIAFALRLTRDGLPRRREMRAAPRPERTGKTARMKERNAGRKAVKSLRDRALRASMKGGGAKK